MAAIITPPITIEREERDKAELASTVVARRTAVALVLFFLVAICASVLLDISAGRLNGSIVPPLRSSGIDSPWLRSLEENLNRASVLKNALQPRLQLLLTELGGFGNEKVTIGRDGTLFYTPGLRSLFGEGFLDGRFLKTKAKRRIDKEGARASHPDPVPAIIQLNDDCKRWGIRLMVVPIPDKGVLLGPGAQNPSLGEFERKVRTSGVDVVDVAAKPEYLRQDTHWTPGYMDNAARQIAERIRATGVINQAALGGGLRLARGEVSNGGDLVAMLGLPGSQTLFPPEAIEIDRVVHAASGEVLKADRTSPVLVLGDSFTNVYSSTSLAWGEGAGFAEHIAYHLGVATDAIAINGSAATAVRVELARAAAEGRLDSKRVIVYEFASRDLYLEDWEPVRLPAPPQRPSVTEAAVPPPERPSANQVPVPAKSPVAPIVVTQSRPSKPQESQTAAPVTVRVRITAVSKMPEPGASPYKDCLIVDKALVIGGAAGLSDGESILIALIAMDNEVFTDAARYTTGAALRVTLLPFSRVTGKWKTAQRADDTGDFQSPMFFATSAAVEQ